MSWQTLTCISVFLFSFSVLVQRRLMHQYVCEPYAFVVFSQVLVGIFALSFALVNGFIFPDFSGLWLPVMGSISFHGLGYILHAKALQAMEASVFSVFYATQAIWILLLGVIIFHEYLGLLQIIGVACIFGSIALLTYQSGKIKLDKITMLGFLMGLFFGIAVSCWIYVGRQVDTISWAAVGFWGVAFTAFLMRPRAVLHVRSFLNRPIALHMLAVALLLSAGSILLLLAYAAGDVSTVSPLRQMSIIVTMLLAMIFLPKERTELWRKITAMVLCFSGAVLVV